MYLNEWQFFFDTDYYVVAVWGRFEIWYTPIDKNQNQSAPYFLFWLMWYIFVSCLCAYLLCSKAHYKIQFIFRVAKKIPIKFLSICDYFHFTKVYLVVIETSI